MVGFKSIALLISLLLFAACVPQTKQTECSSNEAFSAALRTCVPVVNGPSSFINIDSFLPTTSLTKYKNDTTAMTFSVVIDNPYAQTYTVEWERIFNGVPVPITPNTETSYSFAPTFLATQVGIHIISVKVKDTSNKIVDSHNFQLVINENPKPVIQSATVTPALYASAYTPLSASQNFQFTIYNNSAITLGAGYRTDWKLYQSGVLIYSETDVFTSTTTTGYNYPVMAFSPSGLGVGSYVIVARVTNTAAEVVAEQQWSATVSHPSLSKVSLRNIYTGASPVYSTSTIAYNGVAYTGSPTYNFLPSSVTPPGGAGTQGDYCVSIANTTGGIAGNGDGVYVGDGLFVRVDYYLDGGTLVYSNSTTTTDNKVCLTDAAAITLSSVIFNNSSPTSTQTHTLVARVTDEATGFEYATSDMNANLGTYPITWNFTVKPQNAAPTATFGAMTLLTCSSTSGTTKSGCSTTSDTIFSVKVTPASDDFYYPVTIGNEANWNYSIRLYRDGVLQQTCTKSDAGEDLLTDMDGTDGYDCAFNIESYNGSGPIDLATHTFSIQAEVSDTSSPISGTGATSSTLLWNFTPVTGVTEKETVPVLGALSASSVFEGATTPVAFSVDITDAERDNHTYSIKYCTNLGCTTSATLTTGTITRTSSTALYTLNVSYALPEDFLLGLNDPTLNCDDVARSVACAVTFFITVTDVPNTATPLAASTTAPATNIFNYNPSVLMNTLASSPVPTAFTAATTFAFVGHPLTVTNVPGTLLNDTSAVTAEKAYRYQWYSKHNLVTGSIQTWTAIDGATNPSLVWTPSHILEANVSTDEEVSFMLCVEDQPVSVPTAATVAPVILGGTAVCTIDSSLPWIVKVRNNLSTVYDLSSETGAPELATSALAAQYGKETAVWYDVPTTVTRSDLVAVTSSASYIAMIANDKKIYIKKVLVKTTGGIDTIDNTAIVSFDALPSPATVSTVKNLSITGYSGVLGGTELYVAYLASASGSPGSFYPQVRRIDLTASTAKSGLNNHIGKFGFDYDGLAVTEACINPGECTATTLATTTTIAFNSPTALGSFTLKSPRGDYIISFNAVPNGITSICSNACTNTVIAGQLVNLINTSTDQRLAGYSASSLGATVTIHGAGASDYFDSTSYGHAADQLGKIYISGNSWYVPFIDTSLGGSDNDRLSVYTSTINTNMSLIVETLKEPSTVADLQDMDAAIKFDNYYDGTFLWIAMVSKTGSAGRLYKVDPATYAYNNTVGADWLSIMASDALLNIQVAASSPNNKAWVVAETVAGNEYKIGVYDNNVDLNSAADEFLMNNAANVESGTDTDDFFNLDSISSFKIEAYGTEARIFAASQDTPVTGIYKLYVARLRTVSSVWTLSCGECQTISESSANYNVSGFVSIGVAPIRDNPSALYDLASSGSTALQGRKDVAFVSFGRTDTGTASICDPALGVFNMEAEAVESTTIFQGPTSPNEDAGLYRPPFIKN